jgi:drug/metabolite transporter (DMT)-like permease
MERSELILKFLSAPVIVLALLLGGAAFWGANKQILGLFHDDAIYVVAGKALASGDGYRIESLPGAPPQTKYPFLFAALLSLLWRVAPSFPKNIGLLKSLNVLILVAIFLSAVAYFRRSSSSSRFMAALFAVLVCTNPIIFSYTDYVLSDLLLVLFTLIALTMCSGTIESSPFERGGLREIFRRTKFQIPLSPFFKGGN